MIAAGFLAAGAKVYIVSHEAEQLAEAERELSLVGACSAIKADLSQVEGCRSVAATLSRTEDHLDILVNNAGTQITAPIEAFSEEAWDAVVDLNLKGPFFLTQALLPLLRARANAEQPGKIINIASVNGLRVWQGDGYAYHASKAGLIHLTRKLAARLIADHICVTAIAPGVFPSALNVLAREQPELMAKSVPAGRVGRDEDIQGLAIYLASRAGDYQVGTTIPIDGGIIAAQTDR